MELGNVYPVDYYPQELHGDTNAEKVPIHVPAKKESLLQYDVGPMQKITHVARRKTKKLIARKRSLILQIRETITAKRIPLPW